MKFEWEEYAADGHLLWNLYIKWGDRSQRVIGTMTKLRTAWRIMEHRPNNKPDFYWLDGGLSLDEAQRAAKLFLCVGRSGVVGRQ